MPGSPRPPGWTSTSATPIRPGSAAPTRTPTGSCASTSPKAPTCPAGDPATSTRSPPNSTIAPANASTGPPLPKPSTNYYPNKQIHPVLQPPRESACLVRSHTRGEGTTGTDIPRSLGAGRGEGWLARRVGEGFVEEACGPRRVGGSPAEVAREGWRGGWRQGLVGEACAPG